MSKRILSNSARRRMAQGGKKADRKAKQEAGRKGWLAMIRSQLNIRGKQ